MFCGRVGLLFLFRLLVTDIRRKGFIKGADECWRATVCGFFIANERVGS